MKSYIGDTFAEVYSQILNDLLNNYDNEVESRGLKFREISNLIFHLRQPKYNTFTNFHRSSKEKYILNELYWYWSGSNRLVDIEEHASMWKTIANDDGTINSAYGYRILKEQNSYGLSPMDWVIETLKRDPGSRQAIMLFTDKDMFHIGNKDVICTMYMSFQIRRNKLNATVCMRSNDIIYGLPNDLPFFVTVMDYVFQRVRKYHTHLQYGDYTHIAHSMHLYDRHYETVKNMLQYRFVPSGLPRMQYPDDLINITTVKNSKDPLVSYILRCR